MALSNDALKTTDSRYAGYIKVHGDESWELDALEPAVLADLVREAVGKFRDDDRWAEDEQQEEDGRQQLAKIAGRFDDVTEFLEGGA